MLSIFFSFFVCVLRNSHTHSSVCMRAWYKQRLEMNGKTFSSFRQFFSRFLSSNIRMWILMIRKFGKSNIFIHSLFLAVVMNIVDIFTDKPSTYSMNNFCVLFYIFDSFASHQWWIIVLWKSFQYFLDPPEVTEGNECEKKDGGKG